MSNRLLDRRVKPRVIIEGKMTYRLENSEDIYEGGLEDLNEEGAQVRIKQDLPAGSRLFCCVEAEEDQMDIEFTATLLHAYTDRSAPLYSYGCAIEVTKLPG